jgi:hypothetical protein
VYDGKNIEHRASNIEHRTEAASFLSMLDVRCWMWYFAVFSGMEFRLALTPALSPEEREDQAVLLENSGARLALATGLWFE